MEREFIYLATIRPGSDVRIVRNPTEFAEVVVLVAHPDEPPYELRARMRGGSLVVEKTVFGTTEISIECG